MRSIVDEQPYKSRFSVSLLGTEVHVAIFDPELARRLCAQFSAAGVGTRWTTDTANPQAFGVTLEHFDRREHLHSPLATSALIHGGGEVVFAESASVLVSGPPWSVTTVRYPTIHILQCGEEVDIHHAHHMIKYPLRAALEAQAYSLVHASGLVNQMGEVNLFVGPRGAGKTTSLIGLLGVGMNAIANDSVLVRALGGELLAVSWPHVVRIADATVASSTELHAVRSLLTLGKDGKMETYFDTLDRAYARKVIKSPGPIRRILAVQLNHSEKGLQWQNASPSTARSIVNKHVVGYRFQTGWLPGWRWEENFSIVQGIAEEMLDRCEIASVVVGTRDASVWSELRDRLET